MSRVRSSAACLAVALAISTQALELDPQGLDLDTGVATRPQYSSEKHIGGVPVLGYEHAYSGKTQSTHILSESEDVVPAFHEEDWIVVLNKGTPSEQLTQMCSMAGRGCKLQSDNSDLPFIALRSTEDDLATVVALASNTASYISLDTIVKVDPIKASPGAGSASDDMIWGLKRIGADKRDFQGTGVHIYVADTGIRFLHEDFGGRAFPFADMFVDTCGSLCDDKDSANFNWSLGTGLCANSSNVTCGDDYFGHGTHCASTAGGKDYGVAPKAIIHSVKVLSDAGPGPSSGIAFGLNLVLTDGERPAVISMSLGGWGLSEVMKTAIDACVEAGITVVVAAGNDYNDACRISPAFVPSAITVGASNASDERAGFSNWGTCVDIFAPGYEIEAANGVSEFKEGGTAALNESVKFRGTSMACPHVAGAAALLLEETPNLTSVEVLAALMASASKDYLTGLSPEDRNELLYVGRDAPLPKGNEELSPTWPDDTYFLACRNTSRSTGPRWGTDECRCYGGLTCYDGDKKGCPLGPEREMLDNADELRLEFYPYNCTTCKCLTTAEAPKPSPGRPVRPPFNFGPNPALLAAGLGTVLLLVAIGYLCQPQDDAGLVAPAEVAEDATTELATQEI